MANFKASFLNNMLNRFINKVSIHIRPRALVAAFSFLLMFVLSSLNVPTSRAATNIQVGVQFHAMWSTYTDSQRITVLDKMAAAHVQWVRIDMDWSWFEHDGKGIIDSANVTLADSIVNAAQARGIKVLVVVKGSPLWANNNQPSNVPPTNPVDYADFMSYMSTHFQGRVAAWQLWNEPNLAPFWSTTSPVTYAALVRATYPKIKAADPQAQVVIGGVSQNNDAWLASMYDAGVSNAYDVLATHPYQGPANGVPELPDDGNPWIMNHISAVRNLMVARGDAAKPIWAAEFGWSSHANNGSEQPWELGVSESQQAEYIVRTLEMFTANHPYVTNMFWYNERNKTTGSPQEDNYGLLYSNLTEKLVYVALKNYLTGVVPPVLKPDLIVGSYFTSFGQPSEIYSRCQEYRHSHHT